MPTRQNALNEWLHIQLNHEPFTLTPLAGDASFRRYFRLSSGAVTRVVMDAPPDNEALSPFINIHHMLDAIGVHTPTVHAADLTQGFALLDDLGDTLFINALTANKRDDLYTSALKTLVQMQQCTAQALPAFDEHHMLKEMALCHDWFLKAYLNLTLLPAEELLLSTMFSRIAARVANQPQVFIHRDYHSRNLMVMGDNHPPQLSVIDFQDAMLGPVTYDLASLLKDCYIKLPEASYHDYVDFFYQHQPLVQTGSCQAFMDEVDYAGLQRHLKVLGIFCRLHLRDHKPNYLQDLPLTMDYTMTCLKRHPELKPLLQFMEDRVLPQFMETSHA